MHNTVDDGCTLRSMAPNRMIGVRLDEETRDRLDRAAEQEHRTPSNLVRMVLTEWLDQRDRMRAKLFGDEA